MHIIYEYDPQHDTVKCTPFFPGPRAAAVSVQKNFGQDENMSHLAFVYIYSYIYSTYFNVCTPRMSSVHNLFIFL